MNEQSKRTLEIAGELVDVLERSGVTEDQQYSAISIASKLLQFSANKSAENFRSSLDPSNPDAVTMFAARPSPEGAG